MTNPLDVLLPKPEAAIPAIRWGVVTQDDPLLIKLDGDSQPLPVSLTSLASCGVGQRVLTLTVNRRMTVLGTTGFLEQSQPRYSQMVLSSAESFVEGSGFTAITNWSFNTTAGGVPSSDGLDLASTLSAGKVTLKEDGLYRLSAQVLCLMASSSTSNRVEARWMINSDPLARSMGTGSSSTSIISTQLSPVHISLNASDQLFIEASFTGDNGAAHRSGAWATWGLIERIG